MQNSHALRPADLCNSQQNVAMIYGNRSMIQLPDGQTLPMQETPGQIGFQVQSRDISEPEWQGVQATIPIPLQRTHIYHQIFVPTSNA